MCDWILDSVFFVVLQLFIGRTFPMTVSFQTFTQTTSSDIGLEPLTAGLDDKSVTCCAAICGSTTNCVTFSYDRTTGQCELYRYTPNTDITASSVVEEGRDVYIHYDGLTYSSCFDVYDETTNPANGEYLIDNGSGEMFVVYCEFLNNQIFTYLSRTNLTYIDVDQLYNNKTQILIRHLRTDGIQYESTYGQISDYATTDIYIQYNSNVDYAPIRHGDMGPYVYVGLVKSSEISSGDRLGFRVNGKEFTFTNCDGNPNTYFTLLFNAVGNSFTSPGGSSLTLWKTESTTVPSDRYLANKFFAQYEIHFGGCGGYLTSDRVNDVVGVTFGLIYGRQ